jgi:hypothetical protein
VATDTIYSDTLAINCGITSAQLFVGTKTHTADVYPINISDCAQVEISERVKQVL